MADNNDKLIVELAAGHPDTGAYNADNELATAELNAENRTKNKTSMSASEVYNAIDATEYIALSDADKEEVWNIIHLGTLNPFGLEATRITAIFPGGGSTITTLAGLRKDTVSRAQEIDLEIPVKVGHVEQARR